MPSFTEVQTALIRCMEAEPSIDKISLSPDASQISTVFAVMQYARVDVLPNDKLTDKQLEAISRWVTK